MGETRLALADEAGDIQRDDTITTLPRGCSTIASVDHPFRARNFVGLEPHAVCILLA